jgi:predicted RNA methylase
MLGSDVSNQDIFIDIGSGKGRMVYLAARHYPFCKVIGVEISSELNNIARSNLQKKLHKLRCKNIELVCSNVSEYKVPDNVTVIYMFNPFQGAVFEDLVDRLNISLSRSPRRIRVIYRNPVMQKCLVDKGFQVVFKQDELVMFEK